MFCLLRLKPSFEDGKTPEEKFDAFLRSDISESSLPYIPENLFSEPRFVLDKPAVLQMNEVADISSPFNVRSEFGNSKRPTMKLLLTDGKTMFAGIIVDFSSSIGPIIESGIKIKLMSGSVSRYGVFLLQSNQIEIIGGFSPYVTQRRKQLLSNSAEKPMSLSSMPIKMEALVPSTTRVAAKKESKRKNRAKSKSKMQLEIIESQQNDSQTIFTGENQNESEAHLQDVGTIEETNLCITEDKEKYIEQNVPETSIIEAEKSAPSQNQLQSPIQECSFLESTDSDPIELPPEVNQFQKEKAITINDLIGRALGSDEGGQLIEIMAKVQKCGKLSVIRKQNKNLFSMECEIWDQSGGLTVKITSSLICQMLKATVEEWMSLTDDEREDRFKYASEALRALSPPLYIIDSSCPNIHLRYFLCSEKQASEIGKQV